MSAPSVWTIPAGLPFLDALVAGLYRRRGRDPLALADVTLLLPTRRACRELRAAFLKTADAAPMLLPRFAALGDLDAEELELRAPLDLPPAVTPLRRQLLLAQLIRQGPGDILPGQAAALARELGRLIDQAHAEEVPFAQLERLVPAELARHWQLTVDFLRIATEHWPALLEAEGAIDPAARRNRIIDAQIAAWRTAPPGLVIAAGFAAANPAAARLLTLVSMLPEGFVVLPGLDTAADDELWAAIGEDPTHPQYGLARLIAGIGIGHDVIRPWVAGAADRTPLLREVMRPAAVSDAWRRLPPLPGALVAGLSRLDLAGQQEEGLAVALLLRQLLERPGATGMLVTNDRGLARRVAAELKRWDIEIDDSAGIPLNQTAPGTLLRLIAEVAAERLAPVPLLALLKHPLADPALHEAARQLEIDVLRGPRPAPGFAGLRAAARAPAVLIDRLEAMLGPFCALVAAPELRLADALAAHIRAAEALAGAETLWAKEAGENLAGFIAELADACVDHGPIAGADYPVLFEALLAGPVVRPAWGLHPRLQILGTLEARLLQADLVVLGALNAGSWPPEPPHDPWLSRPMRRDFGLPPPEAQIGLAAHDFSQLCQGREVVLTRAARAEGAPTVPSRWLLRLDAVLQAAGLALAPLPVAAWAAEFDRPDETRPWPRPAPRPPVSVRPRRLSVTDIETWMRDPYALYARHVLRLDPLDPLDADPGAAERGVFIHQALDEFVTLYPGALPPDASDKLLAIARHSFGAALELPGVWAFWWPRFERIARWFVGLEADRRAWIDQSWTECRGLLLLSGPAGDFELTAKADRIDRCAGVGLCLIDYKTGRVPSPPEVALGVAPQLPLEAAIAAQGGFDGIEGEAVFALQFWRLDGGDPAGEIVPLGDEIGAQIDAALAGLTRLIHHFDQPGTTYPARPRPGRAPRYSAYGHLARLQEWGGEGEA